MTSLENAFSKSLLKLRVYWSPLVVLAAGASLQIA
jgi:hypothetical protein